MTDQTITNDAQSVAATVGSRLSARPTNHDTWMEVAQAISKRATCPRRHVGAVLVRDARIIASGYNGSVPGGLHCEDAGCIMVGGHCRRTLHAELNAIIQCARIGVSTVGAVLYVTTAPCGTCTMLFAGAGINHVYYLDGDYESEFTTEEIYGIKDWPWSISKFTYSEAYP